MLVFADVDLVVAQGERVAIVGPAGSGKSTLLFVAAGLIRPDRGAAWSAAGASLDVSPRSRALRGVAEPSSIEIGRRACVTESLSWPSRGGASLVVARAIERIEGPVDRSYRLEHGQLLPLASR